ncbi:phage tail protein [Niveispirillum sp.]|uniref:phage tail protein n=1 Tax=Niveispirillum sp. TaxID=1917217 RepID=UPI001B45DB9A|nr:tail fiber protein [Niveispirillum sp.]MBP7336174.1 phage tail protein [Niveispirillum sp.]
MDWFVGEIRLFAGNYAPEGWVLADGRALSIQQFPALYALLGTLYGGDGRTSFNVPDLRSRLPLGTGKTTSNSAHTYILAEKGGVESVALTEANLPAHTHALQATRDDADQVSPAGHYLADTPDNLPTYIAYIATATTRVLADQSITQAGGGQTHGNIMPCRSVTYIIATNGIFPTQG